jgi:hypothetical protein
MNPADYIPVDHQAALSRRWRIAGWEVTVSTDVFGLGDLIKRAIASAARSAKGGPTTVRVRRLTEGQP